MKPLSQFSCGRLGLVPAALSLGILEVLFLILSLGLWLGFQPSLIGPAPPLIFFFVGVISTASLFLGLHQKDHRLLFPFLAYKIVEICLLLAASITLAIFAHSWLPIAVEEISRSSRRGLSHSDVEALKAAVILGVLLLLFFALFLNLLGVFVIVQIARRHIAHPAPQSDASAI